MLELRRRRRNMYVMQITVKIDGDLVRMVGLVGIQSIFQKDMPHLNSLGMGMISECLEEFEYFILAVVAIGLCQSDPVTVT